MLSSLCLFLILYTFKTFDSHAQVLWKLGDIVNMKSCYQANQSACRALDLLDVVYSHDLSENLSH